MDEHESSTYISIPLIDGPRVLSKIEHQSRFFYFYFFFILPSSDSSPIPFHSHTTSGFPMNHFAATGHAAGGIMDF
jgi:hypothetical protein